LKGDAVVKAAPHEARARGLIAEFGGDLQGSGKKLAEGRMETPEVTP
jgi:hypothetical protein